ncbi:hypothetical protein LguiB_016269 [Lonicera macranthoides]
MDQRRRRVVAELEFGQWVGEGNRGYESDLGIRADTCATEGPIVADKNREKIHYMAPNIYCCGAGTAARGIDSFNSPRSCIAMDTKFVDTISSKLKLHRNRTGWGSRVIYPHGSTNTLPFATMGYGSLAAVAIF